jgi:hypothetical protein
MQQRVHLSPKNVSSVLTESAQTLHAFVLTQPELDVNTLVGQLAMHSDIVVKAENVQHARQPPRILQAIHCALAMHQQLAFAESLLVDQLAMLWVIVAPFKLPQNLQS